MSGIPPLTEADILARVGDGALQRGRRALREGALSDLRLQGPGLKAVCAGTAPEPYRVHADFATDGALGAHCSCPVGHEGDCKHVAALLLAWLEQPESFARLEPLDVALARLSHEELVNLLRQMLRQQPELEGLLERSLHAREPVPADPETYRREAAALFARGRREWSAEAGIADRLDALSEIGASLASQGDLAGADAVWQGIAIAVVQGYDSVYDEDRRIAAILQRCVRSLAGADNRSGRALFAIYKSAVAEDVDFAEESARDALGDEDLLSLCVERGWIAGRMRRLIQLGRIEEAAVTAEEVGDTDGMALAQLCLRSADQPEASQLASKLYRQQVERLVAKRGRDNYREARRLLERMRPLEERLGGDTGFTGYLGALRDRHRGLRALIEELDAAGLGGS